MEPTTSGGCNTIYSLCHITHVNLFGTDEPFQEVLGHGHHKKQIEWMEASIAAENQDDDGQLTKLPLQTSHKWTRAMRQAASGANPFYPLVIEEASDSDDSDFEDDSIDELSLNSGQEMSNEEVHFIV